MKPNERKSLSVFSRQSKADSISSDLKSVTLVKRNSFNSQTDQKQQNPSYQSYQSGSSFTQMVKQAFGEESKTKLYEPYSTLLQMPQQRNSISYKSKYKSDQEYRLKISYSIVAFAFILLEICSVEDITDNVYEKYKIIRSLIKKGTKILDSVPKIRDLFYEHSSYLGIILRYEMEDILKSDPNIIYKIHHLPKNGQRQKVKSRIKVIRKSDQTDGMYFREFDRQYLMLVLKKLLIKNNYNYFTMRVKTRMETNSKLREFEEQNSEPNNIQKPKISNNTYIAKYCYLNKQYKNPFNILNKSPFKLPSILINRINILIHRVYASKCSVDLSDSVKQNYLLSVLTLLFLIFVSVVVLIIESKLLKYIIMGVLIASLIMSVIFISSKTSLYDERSLRNQILKMLIAESEANEFKYEFVSQESYDIRVTTLNF